jgi:predicted secreted protein
MAVLALISARVEIATIDMSAHVTSIEIPIEAEDLETTNFGSGGWRARIAGLREAQVAIGLNQDFAVTTVDDRIWGWFGTLVAMKVRPTQAAVSTSNPSYEGNVLVNDIAPIAGNVGDLAVMSLTWPSSAAFTRVTA